MDGTLYQFSVFLDSTMDVFSLVECVFFEYHKPHTITVD